MNDLYARLIVDRPDFRLDVDFNVRAGEVVALLGPNGAGKTTLLRALAGLQSAEGDVRVGEESLETDIEKRRIGVVFSDLRLFPHLTVRENVAFGAPGKAGDDVGAWLDRLDLRSLADRKPAQLSGGQAQRAAIARALASRPRLLLLDEPMAALDARTRGEVRGHLKRHLADFAGPVVMVTHDPVDAMVLADRLVVLEHGRIVQDGAPGDVARRPGSPYVARLMGLNLYAGRVAADRTTAAGFTVADLGDLRAGDAALVAIRPSAITVHTRRPQTSSRNVWEARVTGVETLTDRVRLSLTGRIEAMADVTLAAVAELELAEGSRVWLSAKATEIEAYAQET